MNKKSIIYTCKNCFLTLIWVGFLGLRFEVCLGGEAVGVKLHPPTHPPTHPPPCLKLVRIMLETSYLARK